MSIAQSLIHEVEHEAATTRRFLEQLPADALGWKPHEKSMTAGQLALHIASIPGSIARMAEADEAPPPNSDRAFPEPSTVEEVLVAHDESVAGALASLEQMDDTRMGVTWSLMVNGQPMMSMPRAALYRTVMCNHLYHHRGQFGVYLRLLGATVPSAYGPSADEVPAQFQKMVDAMATA